MPEIANIAGRLRALATTLSDKPAIAEPGRPDAQGRAPYRDTGYRSLVQRVDALAAGLLKTGIGPGCKTLVMLRPGADFHATTFALFTIGAVPVLIDPGMGRARLLHCIEAARPEAFIGIGRAQLARVLFPRSFRSVRVSVTAGRRWLWGGHRLATIERTGGPVPALFAPGPEDLAAILFTTGSTGPAKGVEYTHAMFDAQCDLIARTYAVGPEDVDLPTFPLFGLFSVALGMTAVIPAMDPTRPAFVDPRVIVNAIQDRGCTFSFGSPALWARVSRYCVEQDIRLPTLKRVLMAGAPVPPEVHERLLDHILPEGASTHTPYGATESLPVSDMSGREVLDDTAAATRAGRGTCVGRPVGDNEVVIIAIDDGPLARLEDAIPVGEGELGEMAVTGPTITRRYHDLPEHTARAKMVDGQGRVWHRLGDLGYRDEAGRLWFCGRKAHRVETAGQVLCSVCCEAVSNRHPEVARSALVGLGERGDETPLMIVEPTAWPVADADRLCVELLAQLHADPLTRLVRGVLLHRSFPVDIRHNAKIFREQLQEWAAREWSGP